MLILVHVFDWLCSVSHFFFLYQSLSSSLYMVFDAISYKIDEVLSINTSTNVFVFLYFNSHHKDRLSYPAGVDRHGELLCNFSILNDRTQRLTFLLRFLTVTLAVLFFWVYLFPQMLIFAPLLPPSQHISTIWSMVGGGGGGGGRGGRREGAW